MEVQVLSRPPRADGEIGIHVRFRSVSRKGWRFESSSAHRNGAVAQLVERLFYTEKVTGSSPVSSTLAGVAKWYTQRP